MNIDLFDPRYLVTLDEIYHSHWIAEKKRRIGFMRQAVLDFWPKGHPTRLIHVTGTNGKGSVAFYLEQGLRFAGNTGSWTGPHVFDYAERFHLNGQQAGHDEIVAVYREILEPYQTKFMKRNPGLSLSFAELGILMALHLFDRRAVAWGVMEVGAGGRYTPLMGLTMKACVLTNIGDDHPKSLGAEVWQRALEKAGVARPGIPFFTAATGDARAYVTRAAKAEGAEVFALDQPDLEAVSRIDSALPEFQIANLALACKLIRHFYSGKTAASLLPVMTGKLAGRFLMAEPNVLVDVAHNPDKLAAFAQQLQINFPAKKIRFLVGLTRTRDPKKVFAPILPLAESIVTTSASYAGQDPADVANALREVFPGVEAVRDPLEALAREKAKLAEGELLVVTGSAYTIDQALNPNPYIRHLNANFGWRTRDKDEPAKK